MWSARGGMVDFPIWGQARSVSWIASRQVCPVPHKRPSWTASRQGQLCFVPNKRPSRFLRASASCVLCHTSARLDCFAPAASCVLSRAAQTRPDCFARAPAVSCGTCVRRGLLRASKEVLCRTSDRCRPRVLGAAACVTPRAC